jgi:hypothetical protein
MMPASNDASADAVIAEPTNDHAIRLHNDMAAPEASADRVHQPRMVGHSASGDMDAVPVS